MNSCIFTEKHKEELCINHIQTLKHGVFDGYGEILLDKTRLLLLIYSTMTEIISGKIKVNNDVFKNLIKNMENVIYYYEG